MYPMFPYGITIINSESTIGRLLIPTNPVKKNMVLSEWESFGYEYGMIIKTAMWLLVAQITYACLSIITTLGSPAVWLFLLYLKAVIVTVAHDIHYLKQLPAPLPQHIRACTNLAVYFVTNGFLHVGDGGSIRKATQIAQNYIDNFGGFLSCIMFIPTMYLSNCAFIALARMLINMFVLFAIAFQRLSRHVFNRAEN